MVEWSVLRVGAKVCLDCGGPVEAPSCRSHPTLPSVLTSEHRHQWFPSFMIIRPLRNNFSSQDMCVYPLGDFHSTPGDPVLFIGWTCGIASCVSHELLLIIMYGSTWFINYPVFLVQVLPSVCKFLVHLNMAGSPAAVSLSSKYFWGEWIIQPEGKIIPIAYTLPCL